MSSRIQLRNLIHQQTPAGLSPIPEMDSIMKAIKGSILLEDVKLPGSPDAWRYGPYILNGKEFLL